VKEKPLQLARLERRHGEELRIEFTEVNGAHLVVVRAWTTASDGSMRVANGRGITLAMSEVFLVRDALDEACRLAAKVRR
jgi:hypothetical protein